MKTLLIRLFGLCLVLGATRAGAQLPPPPAEGPATARPTNLTAAPTNAPSIFTGEIARLTEAHRFRFDRAELVGRDLMITAYPV